MEEFAGFFIDGGAVRTHGIDACALNTILRMCTNSDFIIDGIINEK